MKRHIARHGVVLALVLAAGCATPENRIKHHPDLFSSFPPQVQENVRQGRVEIGYSKDMAYIALGNPDRTFNRVTEAGTNEVWSYVNVQYSSHPSPVFSPVIVRDGRGRYAMADTVGWYDVQSAREFERLRLEFKDGKVVAIEHLQN